MKAHDLAAKLLRSPNLPVVISTAGQPAEAEHVELMTFTAMTGKGYADIMAVAITSYPTTKA